MRPVKLSALFGVLALLVAACGPAATPTPTTTAPAATAMRATATPISTGAPGATPVATPTPAPSPTPAAGGPKYGGVFRNYVMREVRSWDLQKDPGQDYPLQYAQTATFSRLVQWEHATADSCVNPEVLNLAESYKFLDDRTLEVKVRPNVQFQNKPPVNGRAMTSADVVFSFQRAKQVARTANIVPYIKIMDRVEATGPLTVRFHFSEPFATAPQTMLAANMVAFVLPPEAGGPGPEKDYSDPYKAWIGTGPFMFKEWVPGVKTTFTRNPNYFKPGMPYLDGIENVLIPDSATQMAALISGKLDAMLRVPPSLVDMMRKTQPKIVINGCPYFSAFGTVYMRIDKAPWNDVRVRRALSMAIDRQALIDSLFFGEGELLTLIPSQYGGYSLAPKDLPPDIRRYIEYGPEEAKKLLAEAGFPNGLTTTLELSRALGTPFNESQEALIAMWAKVGVKTEVRWYASAQMGETILVGKYENLAWNRAFEASEPFSLSTLHSRAEVSANKGRINDPQLDRLIDSYMASFDEKESMALARQIQARVVEQAYVIQQPTPLEYAALHPYVKNFGRMSHQSRSATIYERMWFDR